MSVLHHFGPCELVNRSGATGIHLLLPFFSALPYLGEARAYRVPITSGHDSCSGTVRRMCWGANPRMLGSRVRRQAHDVKTGA